MQAPNFSPISALFLTHSCDLNQTQTAPQKPHRLNENKSQPLQKLIQEKHINPLIIKGDRPSMLAFKRTALDRWSPRMLFANKTHGVSFQSCRTTEIEDHRTAIHLDALYQWHSLKLHPHVSLLLCDCAPLSTTSDISSPPPHLQLPPAQHHSVTLSPIHAIASFYQSSFT